MDGVQWSTTDEDASRWGELTANVYVCECTGIQVEAHDDVSRWTKPTKFSSDVNNVMVYTHIRVFFRLGRDFHSTFVRVGINVFH